MKDKGKSELREVNLSIKTKEILAVKEEDRSGRKILTQRKILVYMRERYTASLGLDEQTNKKKCK